MEKSKILNDIKDIPKVKKFFEGIKSEKNWIDDLIDLVDKRINHFFKLSYFENKTLSESIAVVVFKAVLLRIVSAEEEYLTPIHPIRRKLQKINTEPGSDILGYVPLDNYDSRRLEKATVNRLIDEYIGISKVIIYFLKEKESFALKEYYKLFKEKIFLKEEYDNLVNKFEILEKNKVNGSNKQANKNRVGVKLKFSNTEFLSLYNALNQDQKSSLRSIGRAIKIAPNTVSAYLAKCNLPKPK